jgi:hypothetical protein
VHGENFGVFASHALLRRRSFSWNRLALWDDARRLTSRPVKMAAQNFDQN